MAISTKLPTAQEIMREKLITLKPEMPVLDGIYRLLQNQISGAPVVDKGGNYLGVFSEKCCLSALVGWVDDAADYGRHVPSVKEFMNQKIITLSPHDNVFESIDKLLAHRISGAPVLDDQSGNYLGVFSEKTAMQVVMGGLYESIPGSQVSRYMNLDRNRLLDSDQNLHDTITIFLHTPYRRLPVLHGEKLAGQVSRRDVIRSEYLIASQLAEQLPQTRQHDGPQEKMEPRLIGDFLDRHALTKTLAVDMLEIAESFLNSPYRRIPIVENGKLLGQISRRDLLALAVKRLVPKENHIQKPLYLSAVTDTIPPQIG